MNLKAELQKMEVSDLKFVCRELGVSCPKTKRSIIKKLLLPLKKEYKFNLFGRSTRMKSRGREQARREQARKLERKRRERKHHLNEIKIHGLSLKLRKDKEKRRRKTLTSEVFQGTADQIINNSVLRISVSRFNNIIAI